MLETEPPARRLHLHIRNKNELPRELARSVPFLLAIPFAELQLLNATARYKKRMKRISKELFTKLFILIESKQFTARFYRDVYRYRKIFGTFISVYFTAFDDEEKASMLFNSRAEFI